MRSQIFREFLWTLHSIRLETGGLLIHRARWSFAMTTQLSVAADSRKPHRSEQDAQARPAPLEHLVKTNDPHLKIPQRP
jgi:hypothetical protein